MRLRALEALEFIASRREQATTGEIARALGMDRSSAYRLVEDLWKGGWVTGSGRPTRWRATWKLAEVTGAWLTTNRVRECANRYLVGLAESLKGRAVLAFYEDGDAVYTDIVEFDGHRIYQVFACRRLVAPVAAHGKVLLAYQPLEEIHRVAAKGVPRFTSRTRSSLDEIVEDAMHAREMGYAVANGEHRPEDGTVAVPVLGDGHEPIAAVGMQFASPIAETVINQTVPVLKTAARNIALDLGVWTPALSPPGVHRWASAPGPEPA